MPTVTDRLAERRARARADAEEILARAAGESRDLSTDELAEHGQRVAEEREAADELDRLRDEQIADLRANVASYRGGAPTLSRSDQDADQAFRSMMLEKNPTPIEIRAEQPRVYSQPGLEQRDLLKSTATQAMPVSVYDRLVLHMVENSAVMAAGATVITTTTGEDLQVPKSTAFNTAALISEGGSITESDATLAVSTLKAYKFAAFFQVSLELANDTPVNLLDALARQAGTALATAYGPYLITGTGTSQPQGIVTAASVGKTGPTGTATSLGTQATAGQGTDVLYDLIGSLAEPYSRQSSTGFIMTNASLAICRKLKDSAGQPVAGMVGGALYAAVSGAPSGNNVVLGYPTYVDPNVAAMAANAKSIIFGDMSRYFVRIVNGVRFERSDEYAFQNDLASFKCVIRLDGGLVDANGIKLFQNSAT
jgi:HK97 family phage major capsid protein